jgi:hypothetical protein
MWQIIITSSNIARHPAHALLGSGFPPSISSQHSILQLMHNNIDFSGHIMQHKPFVTIIATVQLKVTFPSSSSTRPIDYNQEEILKAQM